MSGYRIIPFLGLLMLGACSQETLAPAEPLAPSLAQAAPAAFQGGCAFPGNDVVADGLHHIAVGKAMLSVNSNGDLVVAHLRKNGEDGACTRLPGVRGVVVSYPFPEAMSDIMGSMIERYLAANGTQVFESSLRIRPNGRVAGYMDYTDDSCMNTVVVRHNGQVVRSRSGTGRVRFMLPSGFLLTESSFKGGIGMMRGIGSTIDGKGDDLNVWSVTGTPAAACRRTPKLAAVLNLFDPKTPGGSVTLSWATFPSD